MPVSVRLTMSCINVDPGLGGPRGAWDILRLKVMFQSDATDPAIWHPGLNPTFLSASGHVGRWGYGPENALLDDTFEKRLGLRKGNSDRWWITWRVTIPDYVVPDGWRGQVNLKLLLAQFERLHSTDCFRVHVVADDNPQLVFRSPVECLISSEEARRLDAETESADVRKFRPTEYTAEVRGERLRDVEERESERGICVVCWSAGSSELFLPCAHVCVCARRAG